ncbi:hypothetical protein F4779DRAFT_358225 [Xylariaceae sp. FL0662B]|nr:hypothetical protein F4779DRAFT_358225 [Xylariaceae sp. FL0662B]
MPRAFPAEFQVWIGLGSYESQSYSATVNRQETRLPTSPAPPTDAVADVLAGCAQGLQNVFTWKKEKAGSSSRPNLTKIFETARVGGEMSRCRQDSRPCPRSCVGESTEYPSLERARVRERCDMYGRPDLAGFPPPPRTSQRRAIPASASLGLSKPVKNNPSAYYCSSACRKIGKQEGPRKRDRSHFSDEVHSSSEWPRRILTDSNSSVSLCPRPYGCIPVSPVPCSFIFESRSDQIDYRVSLRGNELTDCELPDSPSHSLY